MTMPKKNRNTANYKFVYGGDPKNRYEVKDLAERYGIDTDEYKQFGRPGLIEHKTYDQLADDVVRAMANDYSVRTSMHASREAGSDAAPKKIVDINDAFAADRFMEDTYSGALGRGGKYSHDGTGYNGDGAIGDNQDIANYWLEQASKGREDIGKDDKESEEDLPAVRPEYEPSEYLAAARARVQLHDEEILSGQYAENLYNKDYNPTDGGGFLARYKLRMVEDENGNSITGLNLH